MRARKLLCRSQTRIDLLFTMSKIPQARPLGQRMQSDVFADVCFWRSGLADRWSARLRSRATPGTLRLFSCVAAPREAQRAKRGGARRDRTDDLMLAKHALSQLSYGPVPEDECFLSRSLRARLRRRSGATAFVQEACRAEAAEQRRLVGLGRLELPTSRLSSARSNQLSYKPLTLLPLEGSGTCSRAIGSCQCIAQAPNLRTALSPWRVFVREERET